MSFFLLNAEDALIDVRGVLLGVLSFDDSLLATDAAGEGGTELRTFGGRAAEERRCC
jgi:hypothetical protein